MSEISQKADEAVPTRTKSEKTTHDPVTLKRTSLIYQENTLCTETLQSLPKRPDSTQTNNLLKNLMAEKKTNQQVA